MIILDKPYSQHMDLKLAIFGQGTPPTGSDFNLLLVCNQMVKIFQLIFEFMT